MATNALERLIAEIEAHYRDENALPLLLSSFGQRHKQLLGEVKEEFGSLKAAIAAAGPQRIGFIDKRVGREAVAPAEKVPNLQLQIEEADALRRQSSSSFDSLPPAVKIAFCVKTLTGEHIAIDTVRPFQFAKVTTPELIRPTQRIISDKYRRPGLSLRTASVQERESLWRHFLAWCTEVAVDPATFRQVGATNALARLIAAQSPDVIPRLVIPADIAQILLKQS